MKLFKAKSKQYSNHREIYEYMKNVFGCKPKNIFLYELAFRHRSVASELVEGIKDSNERLEFLGDAVLGAIVADILFKRFPLKSEGFLTEMRSKIVSRANMNKLSQKLGTDKILMNNLDGKNIRKTLNGDALEAIIGAIYLDKGYKFTHKIILDVIINRHLDIDEIEKTIINFKSLVIQWAQKEKKKVCFKVKDEIGAGMAKQYLVALHIDDEIIAEGREFAIKKAEQDASEKACKVIGIIPEAIKIDGSP